MPSPAPEHDGATVASQDKESRQHSPPPKHLPFELEDKFTGLSRKKNEEQVDCRHNTTSCAQQPGHERVAVRNFPIAVVGIGCRLPGDVNNTSDFWDVVSSGRDTISQVPKDRWSLDAYHSKDNKSGTHVNTRSAFISDMYGFDNSFFKISPREAAMMDPQQRHLLEVTYEAFVDAGIVPEKLQDRCGVYVGIGMMDYPLQLVPDKHMMNAYIHTGVAHSVAANRLSYVFNLRGPSMAVDTACASSMTSTHLACRALWNDECDIAITAGSNVLLLPETTVGFSQLGVLSPEGRSCPFDESAKGYVRGEGFGTVILKPLQNAVRDNDHVYCVITGSVVGDNGNSQSITMPSASAQEELMRSAYAKFGIPLSEVDYVEAHGTGTPVGDPIEAKAISAVFKGHHNTPLRIGSAKGNFGHLECAAGIVGIIKTSLMLENRTICPSGNFSKVNPHIDLDDLQLTVQQSIEKIPENKTGVIGVNSFGFGGALAHMIFEETPTRQQFLSVGYGWKFGSSDVKGIPAVVPLSAKSSSSLDGLVGKWSDVTSTTDAQGVIGYTSSRRNHFAKRVAFVAASGLQFKELTSNFATTKSSSPDVICGTVNEQGKPRICMVFPGQGQQWNDMGRQLFKTEQVFRDVIQKCDNAFSTLSGFSLLEKHGVFKNASNGLTASETIINQVEISQPAILFMQIGLYSLWKHWGVEPDVIIGHSLGEVAAAFAGGFLTLEDAVAVIYHRSRLQAHFVGKGAMAAYRASVDDATKLCKSHSDLHVACINAPGSVTLAGDEDIIQSLAEQYPTQAKRLRVKCAFHTPHMEPMKDQFLESTDIHPLNSQFPAFYSTVTGERIQSHLDVQYWWDNIRNPVNFLSATQKILQDENIDLFLECSASPTLMSCVSQTAKNLKLTVPIVVTSCQRQKDDRLSMLRSLGNVYVSGGNIDWAHVNNNNCQWAPVPAYSWDHVTLQEESEHMKKNRLGLFDRTFKGQHGVISTEMFPYLADHVVNGSIVFPGAGYIEYGLQSYCADNDTPSLEDVQLKHVFVLEEKSAAKLEASIDGSVIHMTSDKGEHAQMKLSHTKATMTQLPIKEIRERCSTALTTEHIYDSFRDIGLEYGTAFEAIKEVYVSSGEAFALLTCAKSEERIHVPTLDGCFQVALIAAGLGTTTYLPVKINKFNMRVNTVPCEQQLVAYAKVTDHSHDSVYADIILASETGELLVEMLGFVAQNVSGTKSGVDTHSCLYTTAWQPRKSCLPPTKLAEEIFSGENLAKNYADELEKISKVEPFMITVDKIAISYSHHALSQVAAEDRHPRNEKYVKRLEQMIAGRTDILDFAEAEKTMAELQQKLPEMKVELSMFQRLGSNLCETLKEPSGALSVLFAADALATYFIDSLTTRLYYKAGADIVCRAIEEAGKRKSVVRVLEVGGRMGGLARYMLKSCSEMLNSGHLEYVFTDLNTTFFAHARQTLADFPQVKYKQLDIERDVSEQGFVPGTFDIVICMDTLHSAVHLNEGLKNMTDLLSEDGWMMMYEATRGFSTPEIIFGSLELCWVYADERVDTCWLPQEGWCELFTRGGLKNVVAVSSPNEFFHSIIFGQKSKPSSSASVAVKSNERWVLITNSAEESEHFMTMLPSSTVETYTPKCLPAFDQLVDLDERKLNIAYIWDKNDRTLTTTMKLVKEAHAHLKNIESFWVVTLGNKDTPFTGLPTGFTRVVCNEMPDFPMFTVTIDNIESECRQLREIFLERNLSDRELVLTKTDTLVPRLVRNNMIHDKLTQVENWKLDFPQHAKHVDEISFYEYKLRPLSHNQVLVKVSAAAVNFKDIMMTTGLLDGLSISPQFGLECAGTVQEVSKDVTHLKPGDEVIAFGDHCFGSHAVCHSDLVVKKPPNIQTTDAAGVAIVYTTAYHALIERARLTKGESVLIHSACGGVGQAAIQVARMVGAQVFCTAGSEMKREYLRNKCNVPHVADSHSLSFADDILEWTQGEGVDVILNSLSGEYIRRGIDVLKPGGRFCEIGKRDILSNSSLQMQSLLENKSFMSVQIDIFMNQRPTAVKRILEKVCSLLEEGTLKPIETHVRCLSEYKDTFRWMMTGKHIGKIVMNIARFTPAEVKQSPQCFKPEATYLVTGGLGGIGQALVRWMGEKGAKHIAVMSRSGCKTRLQRCTLEHLQRQGITVYEKELRSDVASKTAVEQALQSLLSPAPPLKGVFHLAAVIDDSSISKMTEDQLTRGIRAKAFGAYNLHECTKHLDLDYFVMMSSINSVWGNPEQASYCAANAFLDELATQRRNEGLPGLSLQMGAVRGAGFLEGKAAASKIVHSKGLRTLHIAEYLEMFSKILQQADVPPVVALANMEWESTAQFCHRNMMKIRHLLTSNKTSSGNQSITSEDLEKKFIAKLSEILYVSADAIDTSRPMIDYGVDSLMAVDMVNWVNKEFDLSISQLDILGGMTTASLLEKALAGEVVISF